METPKDEVTLTKEFKEVGVDLGLSGLDLVAFIEKKVQDVMDRRERSEARALEKGKVEAEAKKAEVEAETKKAEVEAFAKKAEEEEKTRRIELEAKTRRIELEMEVKKAEVEEQTKRKLEEERTKRIIEESQVKSHGHKQPAWGGGRTPRLPMFNEQTDQVDAFLFRFEEFAKLSGCPTDQWAFWLSTHLERTALELYHGLQSEPGAVTYEVLKNALLTHFSCTAESARLKFRQCRPEQGNTAEVFGSELRRTLNRWLEARGVVDVDGLKDLLLQEQFLESVSRDVAVFTLEREPTEFGKMIKLMESYRVAHPGKSMAKRVEKLGFAGASQAAPHTQGKGSQPFGPRKERGPGRKRGSDQRSGGEGASKRRRTEWKQRSPKEHSKKCFVCGEMGHFMRSCPKMVDKEGFKRRMATVMQRVSSSSASEAESDSSNKPSGEAHILCSMGQECVGTLKFDTGRVNDEKCSVLRDTGANVCGVRKRLVKKDQYTGRMISCVSFGGRKERFELADVIVETEYYTGTLRCCVLEDPVADLIVGNIPNLSEIGKKKSEQIKVAAQVTTRARSRHVVKQTPLQESAKMLDVSREKLIELQQDDGSLSECRKLADSGEVVSSAGKESRFYRRDGILMREFHSQQESWQQIVVPEELRPAIMSVAHDMALSGHCGARKTLTRLRERFHWPGVTVDVAKYVASCDPCQKAAPRGRTAPVPLSQVPKIGTPFERVAIDLVGPFTPASEQGHKYILTMIDVATRYPEAIPLKNVTSEAVAEALFQAFSRLGFPNEILSDRGTQFNSELTKQFFHMCGCKGIVTSPYHPQANGNVERFHGTIKPMLKKMVQDKPKQWNTYLPALLFACRELPSESTGFSPFRLLFGREVRGPIALVAETWAGAQTGTEPQDVYRYVFELQNKIKETCDIAAQNSLSMSAKNKALFDKKAQDRKFQEGDEVLLLLPTTANKLLAQWKGPYPIKKSKHPDYIIEVRGQEKLFHANMLKKYVRRDIPTAALCCHAVCRGDQQPKLPPQQGVVSDWADTGPREVESAEEPKQESVHSKKKRSSPNLGIPTDTPVPSNYVAATGVVVDDDNSVSLPTLDVDEARKGEEDITSVTFGPNLSKEQKRQAESMLAQHESVLTTRPGCYKGNVELAIELTTTVPVRRKMYELPYTAKKTVEEEVNKMLELGVIEKSRSAYAAPVVLVQKKDGSCRFCIDYRNLNKVTVFDAEPIPNMDALFVELGDANFFTKIDLAKGYWQIPVRPEDRHKTAFSTHMGLFQFTRMPFGLLSAPAVFERMMRQLHLEQIGALNFFDDILVHSVQFDKHLQQVDEVLTKLKQSGLTAKPSKVEVGFKSLEFLGHVVGEGIIRPEESKVQKIMQVPIPQTRKQVRSLLGLTGFYRRYIPGYASVTAPLTDLTKEKGAKRKPLAWTPECQEALTKLQQTLSCKPILRLPDMEKPFTLRTDASSTGLGAVLLQEWDGVLFPVLYASRKLLDRETRYSTIERECLGIVWATNKMVRYLHGRQFTLQTDHKPLVFLRSASFRNSRVMRWALALQEYAFEVQPIKGEANTFADLLSRANRDQEIP